LFTFKNYPVFILKEKYKSEIKSNNILQAQIATFFKIHQATLLRWIAEDSPRLTDFNLLNIVWSNVNNPDGTMKLTEILTLKK